jgi:hypothetical protein
MKKLITLLILGFVSLCFAGHAANSYVTVGNANWGAPVNVRVYMLDSSKVGYLSDDTIGTGIINYYGPFALSADPSRPQFEFLRCLTSAGTLGATETLSVEYQIMPGKSWSDTLTAGWVSFDSIKAAAGSNGRVVRIDSLAGVSIGFRLKCLAESADAIMAKPVKILLMQKSAESVDTKH